MRTKVFLTIDTEFSIAGAYADPIRYRPVGEQMVLCQIGDKSHGLGFLLDTFQNFKLPATFFVEALNTSYFGDGPMGALAKRILAAGHDVQLHLHPCWTYMKQRDWKDRLKLNPPTDHMNNRSLEQLAEWMGEGLESFRRWGLPRPVALRTGSLMTDTMVYRAMEQSGLPVGSNIAVGVFQPAEPELRFCSGLHVVGAVLEACVLTYVGLKLPGKHQKRCLTITGASWAETKGLLEGAQVAGVESLVILTHPFEFVKNRTTDFSDIHPNRVNQRRLERLCRFLSENDDRFEVCTMGRLAGYSPASDQNVLLEASMPVVLVRMMENALNDAVQGY